MARTRPHPRATVRRAPSAGAPCAGELWPRYRDNVARHLASIARDLQGRVLGRLSDELGYTGLRPSLGPFLSLVWTEARPLAALAEELAISKQACSQLAGLAEREGYLERDGSPTGVRGRRVRLSDRGREMVEAAIRVILETETAYARHVGEARHRRFTRSCAALFAGLGLESHAEPRLVRAARRSVGVLPLVAVRLEEELLQQVRQRGHPGLKASHAQVLPLVGPDGARVSAIARAHGVTRQAISATARDLDRLGYVRREPDPRDGRGIALRLTTRGESLVRDSVDALDALEARLRQLLGARRLAELEHVAASLDRALRLEQALSVEVGLDRAGPGPSAPTAPLDPELRRVAELLRETLGERAARRLGRLLTRTGDGTPLG